jgi:hypothetical protein
MFSSSSDGMGMQLPQLGPLERAIIISFISYFSPGVRLSPFGTAATIWPIVPAPDDR